MRPASLAELLVGLSWPALWAAFLKCYPEYAAAELKFRQAYDELCSLRPEAPANMVAIHISYQTLGEESWWDVCFKGKDGRAYVASTMPWENWLALPVRARRNGRAVKMPLEEMVAHCLWEMTYYGESQEKIQGLWERRYEDLAEIRDKEIAARR